MNYLAHAEPFLDDPYFVAGTAVPDWLSVVQRRTRARRVLAQRHVDHPAPHAAALARGIVQHHDDDGWFHQTQAFSELSLEFTVALRDLLRPDPGFRPSFLGHILVELLLDAVLVEQQPRCLPRYYAAIDAVDPVEVARLVNQMVTRPTDRLAAFIPRFSAERFLYDYGDDEKLLYRLNHVMRRVGLPALPDALRSFFPSARCSVRARHEELLSRLPSRTGGSPPAEPDCCGDQS